MDFLPIFLDIKGQDCVVIGGGEVATRKIALLLRAGGKVTVIAPELSDSVTRMAENGEIHHIRSHWQDEDLEDYRLVIAATDNRAVNARIAELAKECGRPVNVIDDATAGNFVMPSIIDRTPVLAAVSTGGASPVLARLIRTRLESLIPAGYGRLAELARKYRDSVKQRFADPRDRRRFWNNALQGAVAERVFSGHMEEAEIVLQKSLASTEPSNGMGEVYLVGGGPGDPDLLTFRALR